MAFKCDVCGEAQPAGSIPHRIVLTYREKTYPVRFSQDGKYKIDNGGHGQEIAKEANLCDLCYSKEVKE